MICWANQNSGFLLVILTSVYVIATLAILLIMMKANSLTRKSLNQTENLEQSRLRPYLSIYLKVVKKCGADNSPDFPYGYLYLKNSGLSQANNISIEMSSKIYSEPTMDGEKTKKSPYFIENNIHYLSPNESISDSIGFLAGYYERFESPIFKGVISYSDINNTQYKEEFTVDLLAMKNATPDIEEIKA